MFWKLFDVFSPLDESKGFNQVQISVGIAPSLRLLERFTNGQQAKLMPPTVLSTISMDVVMG